MQDNHHCVAGPEMFTETGTKAGTRNMTGPGPRPGSEIRQDRDQLWDWDWDCNRDRDHGQEWDKDKAMRKKLIKNAFTIMKLQQ